MRDFWFKLEVTNTYYYAEQCASSQLYCAQLVCCGLRISVLSYFLMIINGSQLAEAFHLLAQLLRPPQWDMDATFWHLPLLQQ